MYVGHHSLAKHCGCFFSLTEEWRTCAPRCLYSNDVLQIGLLHATLNGVMRVPCMTAATVTAGTHKCNVVHP